MVSLNEPDDVPPDWRARWPSLVPYEGMREPNLEELRASGAPQEVQAGARPSLNAFNRGARMRHAQLGTWWEPILAVLGAAILLLVLVVNVWRSL